MFLDFRSPRRKLIDKSLSESFDEFNGIVLDVGGGRERGEFDEPKTDDWITVDIVDEFKPNVVGDATQLPFSENSVDAIKCTEVIEHVKDPDAVIKELGRVLKPGGSLFLSMPFNFRIHGDPYDYQRYTDHKLRQLIAKEFKIELLVAQGSFFTVLSTMFHGIIINMSSPLKRAFYPFLPLLSLLSTLDEFDAVAESAYLSSYTTGYFIIASRKGSQRW